MKFKSLKYKIIAMNAISILSLGVLASLAIFFITNQRITNILKDLFLSQSVEHTNQIESIIKSTQSTVATISLMPQVSEALSSSNTIYKSQLTSVLLNLNKYNNYLAIYVLDKEGTTIASTDPRLTSQNYSFRNYFKDAINGQAGFEQTLGVSTQTFGYYFSNPIVVNNKIVGVVVIKQDPKQIFGRYTNAKQARNTNAMIVDQNGLVHYSLNPQYLYGVLGKIDPNMSSSASWSQYDEVMKELKGYVIPKTFTIWNSTTKTNEVVSVSRIGTNNIFLISTTNTSEIFRESLLISIALSGLTLAAALTALLINLKTVTKSLEPLYNLADYSKKVATGNLDEYVSVNSDDEFGQLANAFNLMVKNLKEFYTNLNKKVESSTKELNTRVDDLERMKKAMINIMQDLEEEKHKTDLHARELEKFQLAVEHSSDHIVITDQNGKVLYANAAVEQITGYSQAEVLGNTPALWGKQMPIDFYKDFWLTIKSKKQKYIGEITNKRKNGDKYIAQISVAPILDAENNVIFYVGVERDITKAKDVDRMKTEFISLASHQLRTPLTAIKWYLEMLLSGDIGEISQQQKDFIGQINTSNERMIELVNALLNVSRIESGRIRVEPTPTDLKQLVTEVLSDLSAKIKDRKTQIVFSCDPNMEKVNLDQKLIRQVYLNLLSNAIKYTPINGEVHVFISKRKDDILTQVTDTGYGIPTKDKDKVFAKFYRGSNVSTIETDGNGLGLYLVKAIIDSSKGNIWFESEEGKGTTFWFTLPKEGMISKAGEVTIDS